MEYIKKLLFSEAVKFYVRIFKEQIVLFLGIAFLIIGIFAFQSDRYCDGNTATYYACTNPSTYYYYPLGSIVLIVIGAFLTLLAYLGNKRIEEWKRHHDAA
jgi:multisubunit Na+/H+ antiporter MnhG subunit